MIVVTGAAGFIGSQIALHLGQKDQALTAVDKNTAFQQTSYLKALDPKKVQFIEAEKLASSLPTLKNIGWIIHMGAITNTAELSWSELEKWNVNYTKTLWDYCAQHQVNFIYASSAATYGAGENGFSDDHVIISKLKPLNLYGRSKQEFDVIALREPKTPPHWYGLKYFNVYGPNENHKGRMASAVWHGYSEIKSTGAMTLFRSHHPDVKDGDQARDFIFVDDVLKIIDFLMEKKPINGIYNCGSGHAGTFMELAQGLFAALSKPLKINWVETPMEFRKAYQYRTQAEMAKLAAIGYVTPMTSLTDGIKKYLAYLNSF